VSHQRQSLQSSWLWKAELQAIAAGSAGAGEGAGANENNGSQYDDQEYELSSVALPVGGARA
jgi:hypothetical protein